ncbi:RecT family recombinase [Nevskia sp.]|uniref:RecT family recombinase n=1 Tax=Nevskia sp. TaxID=1929292 RepID=UPI0025DFFDEF|nr:RecT family recombinase [Nevskia sp.]
MSSEAVTAVAAVTSAEPPMLPDAFMSTTSLVMDSNAMSQMLTLAEVMATAVATVPVHFRGKKGDCLAVIMQSMQWGLNPFTVAQKTHLVSGTLGYEAQLVNAVIIARAPVANRPKFEWFGPWEKIVGKFVERESKTKKDDHGDAQKYRAPAWDIKDEAGCGVTVSAVFRGEKEPRELTLLMTQARTRNSTLWADDPKQQLAYLAIKRWSRLYCPDVIMGVYTRDELEDRHEEIDVTPKSNAPDPSIDLLLKTLIGSLERESKHGFAAVDAAWKSMTAEQRRLIPNADWTRIKIDAVEADKAKASPRGTGSPDAPAPTPQAEPGASPVADPNAPSYAWLMSQVHIATTGDELLQIQSDASHLTPQMQGEIAAACKSRARTLSANG